MSKNLQQVIMCSLQSYLSDICLLVEKLSRAVGEGLESLFIPSVARVDEGFASVSLSQGSYFGSTSSLSLVWLPTFHPLQVCLTQVDEFVSPPRLNISSSFGQC